MAEENSGQVRKPRSQTLSDDLVSFQAEQFSKGHTLKDPADPVADAKVQTRDWESIPAEATIKFRGKNCLLSEVTTYVTAICEIPQYPDLVHIRKMEEKIGNLISEIYVERSRANFAYGKLEAQRITRLGKCVADKDRRSMSAIEARLTANDDPYKAVMALVVDCKSALDFWHDMYNICLRSTDRLKQISMALMAEMKLEPSDQGGKGDRVRGTY